MYYDIALLQLEHAVKYRNHIWPACLANSQMEDDVFTSLSWQQDCGQRSNWLQKNELASVAAQECQNFYREREYTISLPNGITANLFCGNSTTTCVGEIGSA